MILKMRVIRLEKAVVLQILEQDKRTIATDCVKYNGMFVSSSLSPEWEEYGEILYLRGNDSTQDLLPILKTFPSNIDRDAWIIKMENAVQEWIDAQKARIYPGTIPTSNFDDFLISG